MRIGNGGGVLNTVSAGLTVRRCVFDANEAVGGDGIVDGSGRGQGNGGGLAIFFSSFASISNSVFVFQPNGQLVNPVVVLNLGRVTLQGLEAEARYAATEHLQISASFGYQKDTINNYV